MCWLVLGRSRLQRQAFSLAGFQLTASLLELLALCASSRAFAISLRLGRSRRLGTMPTLGPLLVSRAGQSRVLTHEASRRHW